MDNNFNQSNNQYMGQNMNQTQYQSQPQYNNMQGVAMGNYQTTAAQKPNILLGSLGALGAVVVGTILWIVIAAFTGYVIFLLGAGISFLAIFLYEKLAKGMDIIGVIICLVLTCIALYFCVRYGTVFAIANEFDYTYNEAKLEFNLNYALNESFKMEYIKNMILTYVVGIGYTVAMMFKGAKRR